MQINSTKIQVTELEICSTKNTSDRAQLRLYANQLHLFTKIQVTELEICKSTPLCVFVDKVNTNTSYTTPVHSYQICAATQLDIISGWTRFCI